MATRPPPTTTTAPASPRYQTCLNTNSPSPATPTTGPSHRESPKPTAQRLVRPPNGQHRAPTLTTVLRRPRTDRSYRKLRPMLNPLLMRNTRGTPKGSARSPTRCGPGAWPLMRKTPPPYVTRPRRRNAKPFTMHRPMTSTSGPLTNLPSPAIPTISQSHREPPKPKAERKRHQRALTIASTQTTKLPQTNLRQTARPLAPQTRKTNLVAAQMAHGSGRVEPLTPEQSDAADQTS